MPNTHSTLTSLFTDIADAIRAKSGGTDPIVADDFPSAIAAIPSGGGGSYNWMGENPTLVETLLDETGTLDSIGFSNWTPSTSTTTLRSSTALTPFSIQKEDYNYHIIQKFSVAYVYNTSGAATYNLPINFYSVGIFPLYGYASSATAIVAHTQNSVKTMNVSPERILYYTNASGNAVYYPDGAYGVYLDPASLPYISNASGTTPSVTVYTQRIVARGNATYCKVDNVGSIDATQSTFTHRIEVWRVDKGSSWWQGRYNEVLNMVPNS